MALDGSPTNALNQWLIVPVGEAAPVQAAVPHNVGPVADPFHGFPPGYFKIRSRETGLYLTLSVFQSLDGTPVIGWPGDLDTYAQVSDAFMRYIIELNGIN